MHVALLVAAARVRDHARVLAALVDAKVLRAVVVSAALWLVDFDSYKL